MRNLSALKQAVETKASIIVTPFLDGTTLQELQNGYRKMYLTQVVTKRTNAGTAMLSYDQKRTAFVNITPSDYELYGSYLEEGQDYNAILEVLGESKKIIAMQLSTQPFYESQNPVKRKDRETGELVEAVTADGEVYYSRGILAEIGTPDVWGTNDVNPETGYREFEAFPSQVASVRRAEAPVVLEGAETPENL